WASPKSGTKVLEIDVVLCTLSLFSASFRLPVRGRAQGPPSRGTLVFREERAARDCSTRSRSRHLASTGSETGISVCMLNNVPGNVVSSHPRHGDDAMETYWFYSRAGDGRCGNIAISE